MQFPCAVLRCTAGLAASRRNHGISPVPLGLSSPLPPSLSFPFGGFLSKSRAKRKPTPMSYLRRTYVVNALLVRFSARRFPVPSYSDSPSLPRKINALSPYVVLPGGPWRLGVDRLSPLYYTPPPRPKKKRVVPRSPRPRFRRRPPHRPLSVLLKFWSKQHGPPFELIGTAPYLVHLAHPRGHYYRVSGSPSNYYLFTQRRTGYSCYNSVRHSLAR